MDPALYEITEFIFREDAPAKADVILVCGSARPEPAVRAAALYREGYAPYVLPTGRFGSAFADLKEEQERLAHNDGRNPEEVYAEILARAVQAGTGTFPATEWAYQRDLLLVDGVPEEAILCEDRSVNTFENAIFARGVLRERGIVPETMILCCQAFHARRAYMTVQSEFPQTWILVCPAVTRGISRESWYQTLRGYDKVMEEVQKCGAYFMGDRMHQAFMTGIPASEA